MLGGDAQQRVARLHDVVLFARLVIVRVKLVHVDLADDAHGLGAGGGVRKLKTQLVERVASFVDLALTDQIDRSFEAAQAGVDAWAVLALHGGDVLFHLALFEQDVHVKPPANRQRTGHQADGDEKDKDFELGLGHR